MATGKKIPLKALEKKKREEMADIIRGAVSHFFNEGCYPLEFVEFLEDAGVIDIAPPYGEPDILQYTVIEGNRLGGYSGKSYKPGNIIINVRKALMNDVACLLQIPISIGSFGADQPLIGSMAVVAALLSVAGLSETSLSESSSLILISAWEDRLLRNKTTEDNYLKTNEKLKSLGKSTLSRSEHEEALKRLQEVKCIDILDDKIQIRDAISIRY